MIRSTARRGAAAVAAGTPLAAGALAVADASSAAVRSSRTEKWNHVELRCTNCVPSQSRDVRSSHAPSSPRCTDSRLPESNAELKRSPPTSATTISSSVSSAAALGSVWHASYLAALLVAPNGHLTCEPCGSFGAIF